ncbi:hypothetical protein B0H13DRAFT_1987087 [Mycena leptocephala]|nr:hypothetical protein B0H13DRAFT_1987087 [Mycena leptocephala]
MAVVHARISLLSGDEEAPSRSTLAWDELLSEQLYQASSDLAHLRQRPFRSPTPRTHDFWRIEIINQAREVSDFRAGLVAPTEDALEKSYLNYDAENPLAEALEESELARFRRWSFHPHTPAPGPFQIDKSHDFWGICINHQARDIFHSRTQRVIMTGMMLVILWPKPLWWPMTLMQDPGNTISPVFDSGHLTYVLLLRAHCHAITHILFGTLKSSTRPVTCPISGGGLVRRRRRIGASTIPAPPGPDVTKLPCEPAGCRGLTPRIIRSGSRIMDMHGFYPSPHPLPSAQYKELPETGGRKYS